MIHLPSHQHLDNLSIPYQKAEFPAATEKGAASVARALGFRERQMVKTLIFELDTGERILVMVGGDQSIVSGNLKKVAGSRNIKMAGAEAVKEATGYAIGSIPPFSWQPEGFRSFLEVSLLSEPMLGVGTGMWGHEILITPDNLVKASGATLVNLVDRAASVFVEKEKMTHPKQPESKTELLSEIEREWNALMQVVERLGPRQMVAPDAGGWSPKDNLAHLAEWMKILLGYHIDNLPSHEVMGLAPEVTADWDFNVMNQLLFERNRNRSVENVLSELKSVYARVVDRLKSTPFEDLQKPRWPNDPESPSLVWAVRANTSEHFAEHRETIEKALEG